MSRVELSMSEARSVACWRLEQGLAYLEAAQLAARLNPARAETGLTALRFEGRPHEGVCLLGVCMPDAASGALALEDCYVRQRALVAEYALGAGHRAHLEAVWRALAAEDLSQGAAPWAAAGVELILSIRTDRLEDRVQLAVESRVPVEELLGLPARARPCATPTGRPGLPPIGAEQQQTASALHFEHLGPPAALPAAAQSLPAPVCLVYSLRAPGGSEAGYVEAACPNDVPSAELAWLGPPSFVARVRYVVFTAPLEKGVILRARVRGVFLAAGVPAEEYPCWAAEVYRSLASAAPVLGS